MKKFYVKPVSEIYSVEPQNVIATSIGISNESADANYENGGDADERGSWGNLW
jgi:hypothetical protein